MRTVALAVLVVLGGMAAAAHADDSRSVGIVVEGSEPLQGRLELHVTKQLRREGYKPVRKPLSRDALNTLVNCFLLEDLVCARGVVEERAKTPRLVFARIAADGPSLTLDVTWFSSGHTPMLEKHECKSCDEAAWKQQTSAMLQKLAAGAPMPVLTEVPNPERRPRSKLLPRALVTAGALTLVGGAVVMYFGLRDGPDHKYVYPQLTPVGITLIAVGAGATIGGLIWGAEL